MTYQIAMLNKLVLADYHAPISETGTAYEFLVVTRASENGEYLFITEAGRATGTETEAPDMVQLGNTIIGSLIRSDSEDASETFIFNRTSPVGTAHPGTFFPGDGIAEMHQTDDGFVLRASGRHSHALTTDPVTGQTLHDLEPIPNPAPRGLTWLFDALQVDWAETTNA